MSNYRCSIFLDVDIKDDSKKLWRWAEDVKTKKPLLFVAHVIYKELANEYIRDELAKEMKVKLGNGESLL